MHALSSEVQLVRETLEGALAPSVAQALLFDALGRFGRTPTDAADVLALVRGPLAALLGQRLGGELRDEVVDEIAGRLVALAGAPANDPDEFEEGEETRTVETAVLARPVSVLAASRSEDLARRLLVALGPARVAPFTVVDEPAFRHCCSTLTPLVAVVDASQPPAIAPAAMAARLKGLAGGTLAVVWAADTDYGRALRARSDRDGTLFIDRADGVEPFLDLVRARAKQATQPPPPNE